MRESAADRLVRHYFVRLAVALSGVSQHQRDQLLEELQAHVAAARAEAPDDSEASVRQILERLGEPEDIAAEAIADIPRERRSWSLSRRARLIAAGSVAAVMVTMALTFVAASSVGPGPSLSVGPTGGGSVQPPTWSGPLPQVQGTVSLPPAGEPPADQTTARAAVVDAFDTVYAPDSPASEKAALIEGYSEQIVVAGAAVDRKYPSLTASVTPQVLQVVFTSPTEAAVLYETNYQGHTVMGPKVGYAVLDGGTWKVTRATFCQDINNAGAGPTC